MHAKVKCGKHLAPKFKINKSLRKGDAIAPSLFNIVLETGIRRSKVETRGTILGKCSQIMACVDDVIIMGKKVTRC
jgi:hypothetical protein